ncbi:putative Zn(II)2Cys6 transcription factor [Dactylonectria macrodidyma]|uniref:Zn(II)2Cys6 transcription factor n=1 Tax=Dactylonectria macrodidyma TaxID=307937 RepID=A0A9P9E243_9HYPO|nr:putative Zn(II)2Cys6 transcription factor [Dactylonectria macrodidyma]
MPHPRKKLPACDPCRAAKLACDHSKPTCTRCRNANRSAECIYRASPFKKTRGTPAGNPGHGNGRNSMGLASSGTSETDVHIEFSVTSLRPHGYPNPGYLGSSSHAALFDHIPELAQLGGMPSSRSTPSDEHGRHIQPEDMITGPNIYRGAKLIEAMHSMLSVSSCQNLVRLWIAKGANLATAGPFTEPCTLAVQLFFRDHDGTVNTMELARSLFYHTYRPLEAGPNDTIRDYSAQFCQTSTRWETLGLFCIATSRAATDLTSPQDLYKSDQERRDLQRLAMRFSDICLDICLSLDCLNDLQLLLQYENFILHSLADGDQSYHSWKRLGDTVSSLFALGYHQQQAHNPSLPNFLVNLRRAIFAHAYSADKNVSIFLGRPPRIHRRYCRFFLPSHDIEITGRGPFPLHYWPQDGAFDYIVEAQWMALCALLKEEILDLSDTEDSDEKRRKASSLELSAQEQWSAFPRSYRLEEPLMLKDRLVNSGTSLIWKVTYYGLAAAGVICLWLLDQTPVLSERDINRAKIIRDLSVLIAEIETGTLVQLDDPNYKLLNGASQAIKSLLDRLLSGRLPSAPPCQPSDQASSSILNAQGHDIWSPWETMCLRDFETEFWLNLAEHPLLIGSENEQSSHV